MQSWLAAKNFLFEKLTSSFNLIVSICVIGILFSFALILRLNLSNLDKSWNSTKHFQNERNIKNYDFLLNESILSNFEKVVENIYLELASCRFKSKSYQAQANVDDCLYQINAPRPCPDERWINYKHYCFKPVDEKSTWFDAQVKCNSFNSTLLIINDQNKQNFIAKSGLSLNLSREAYFIGLRRISVTNDNWIWSDGNIISYRNWNFGEPNNQESDENCAEMIISSDKNKNGKWNDISCGGIKRYFICEKNLNIDYRDLIFDLIKNKNITEKNLFELTYELFKLSEYGFFSNAQISNIAKIFSKVSNLTKINYHSGLLLFQTLNNILNSPESEFQIDHKTTNSLLNSIERFVKVITLNETNSPFEEIRLNMENLIVRINDMALISEEETSNEFSYLPITQEFIRKFHSFETSLASVLIKSKLNFVRYEANENLTKRFDSSFITDGLNNILSSTRLRISVVYFKNMKLFQSNRLRPIKPIGNQVAIPALSVNVFPLTNSSLVNNKNIIEFEINLKMDGNVEEKSLKCAHWRYDRGFNDGFWSNEGCKYIHYGSAHDFHKCQSDVAELLIFIHRLIIFANLNHNQNEIGLIKTLSLRPFTYVSLFLSNLSLLTASIMYILFKNLRHGLIHKALILLSVSLLSTNNSFILASLTSFPINVSLCILFGTLFHYLLLASFMCMLVISIVQYIDFFKIFDYSSKNFLLKSIIFSFGLSILIPLILICIQPNIYFNQNQLSCFLSGSTLYVSFVGPTAVVLCVQFGFICLMVKKVRKPSTYITKKIFEMDQIYFFIPCIILISLTWMFGFPILIETNFELMAEIAFSLLNGLKGFSVLAYHLFVCRSRPPEWKDFMIKKSKKLKDMSKYFHRENPSAFEAVNQKNQVLKSDEYKSTKSTDSDNKIFTVSHFDVDLTKEQLNYIANEDNERHMLMDEKKFNPNSIKNGTSLLTISSNKLNDSVCSKSERILKRNKCSTPEYDEKSVGSYYSDDISVRISRLNESLKRIKNNREEISKKFSPVSFKLDDLSCMFFDQL